MRHCSSAMAAANRSGLIETIVAGRAISRQTGCAYAMVVVAPTTSRKLITPVYTSEDSSQISRFLHIPQSSADSRPPLSRLTNGVNIRPAKKRILHTTTHADPAMRGGGAKGQRDKKKLKH